MKSTTTAADLFSSAESQSGVYHLLARLWFREADQELIQTLCSDSLHDLFVESGGTVPSADQQPTLDELAMDYCRLFVGPANHIPPYQSVWQDGQFQSAAVASMKEFISIAGYDAASLPSGVMEDHLGVQFSLMGHLLSQFSTWPSGSESRTDLLQLVRAYFVTHLAWPGKLIESAIDRAGTAFYRSVMQMTYEFWQYECDIWISGEWTRSTSPQAASADTH